MLLLHFTPLLGPFERTGLTFQMKVRIPNGLIIELVSSQVQETLCGKISTYQRDQNP